MSVNTVFVCPPLMVWIFNWTSAPFISPLSSNFCKDGKVKVTLTALTVLSVMSLETGVSFSTTTPTPISLSVCVIELILAWFEVPKRGSKLTLAKLKSVAAGLVPAAWLSTWFPFKNTSFNALVLYSAEPCEPVADGKPDMTPSPSRSNTVKNCLLTNTSLGILGSWIFVFSSKAGIVIRFLPLEQYQYQN